MKIGLVGTVSVGKSTLVKALKKRKELKGYKALVERSKYLRNLGIPLNTDSTAKGQMVFMAERASELMLENVLTDRTIWDVCAFTLSSKTIPQLHKERLVEAATTLMGEYDLVIYVSPEGVEIEDNGVRETDSEYRDKIDYAIRALLTHYPPKKLITVSGSTKERIDYILPHL